MTKGRFITLEGIDGAGKTTHVRWLADWLRAQGKPVLVTREPGGTPVGESIRELLLHQQMLPETEALLLFAARHEHLRTLILPALENGTWVICDRFTDATIAYQGGGRGIPPEQLDILERWLQGNFQPDLTLFFDVPVVVSMERLRHSRQADRFEREQTDFFERVRAAYLRRVSEFPDRMHVIRGNQAVGDVRRELEKIIELYCLS